MELVWEGKSMVPTLIVAVLVGIYMVVGRIRFGSWK